MMTGFAGADRRQWWGFTDIGPIQFPANPQYLILTDRSTGIPYWVTFNTTAGPAQGVIQPADGKGLIAITDQLPVNTTIDGPTKSQIDPRPRAYNNPAWYPAFDEPLIGKFDDQTYVRLIIRNAYLGIEVLTVNRELGLPVIAPPLNLIQDTGILGYNGEYATIILSQTVPQEVVWVANTLVQTPNPPLVVSRPPFSSTVDV